MALRAYIDDSFEKERTGWFVLAGFIAEAREWVRFSSEWEKLLPWASHNKNGIREFKASTMMARPSRGETIAPFTRAIDELDAIPVYAAISFIDFEMACGRFKVEGHQLEFSKENFLLRLCFQALLDGLAVRDNRYQAILSSDAEIEFIFDYTSYLGRLVRGWNASKPNENIGGVYGKPPIFEDSEKCMPLQAADYLAWSTRAALNRSTTNAQGHFDLEIGMGAGDSRNGEARTGIGLILPEQSMWLPIFDAIENALPHADIICDQEIMNHMKEIRAREGWDARYVNES